jgi:hypothetical protein
MLGIAALLVGGWLLLTALGLAVLAPLRPGFREAWLPAAPLLGASLIVAVLSSTSWLVPTGWGMLVVAGCALGCVIIGLRRGSRPWAYRARPVGAAIIAWLIGTVSACLTLIPNFLMGDSRVISANPNHDAFYYAAESSWFSSYTMLDTPSVGTDPASSALVPAFAPVVSSFDIPLRMGQPLVQSAINAVLRIDEVSSTMPIMALYALMVPGAAIVTGRMLRLRPSTCYGLAVASATSTLLIYQAYSQNMDSLLGVGLAIAAIGCVIGAAQNRSPIWPAALILSGLVGVYTEYALFVAPAIVGGILLHRSHRYLLNLKRALLLLAVSVLVAPMAWWRGAMALLFHPPSGFETNASPFGADGLWAAINRVTGVAPFSAGLEPSKSGLLLGAVVVTGLILALLLARNTGLWWGLLLVGLGYIAMATVEQRGYTQLRTILLITPLALLACAAGWDGLRRRVGRWHHQYWSKAIGWALVPVLVLWVGVNLRTVWAQVNPDYIASRHVNSDYLEAADWVAELGGANGADVSVLVPDFYPQLWMGFLLRKDDDVSYPILNPSYFRVAEFWGGELDRYLLVGSGVQVDADPGAIVRSNSSFTMLDTSAGAVTVVAPDGLASWFPHTQPGGGFSGSIGNTLLVLRSPGAPEHVSLELSTTEPNAPLAVELVGQDGDVATAELTNTPQPIAVTVPDPSWVVTIEPEADAPAVGNVQLQGEAP